MLRCFQNHLPQVCWMWKRVKLFPRKELKLFDKLNQQKLQNICTRRSFPTASTALLVNPFPLIDTFWCLCSRRLLKTLWQKEKLLKTSNFSLCHNVFNFLSVIIHSFKEAFPVLPRCFQSRLLHIFCMWERLDSSWDKQSKAATQTNKTTYCDNLTQL